MKTYKVSKHAVDRAVERFGWERVHVKGRINQLLQSAQFQGETNGAGKMRKIFDHHKNRIRMILSEDCSEVVTIFPMENSSDIFGTDTNIPTELLEAIRKKAATLSRKYTKELRQVVRQLAVTNVAIAEKELAKLRVNNPKTKAIIDAKLTELTNMRDALTASQSELTEQLAELKKHQ